MPLRGFSARLRRGAGTAPGGPMTAGVAILCSAVFAAAPGLKGVVKGDKGASFPKPAREALEKDSAVVVEGREGHFFALYDRNAYEGIPSFVTLDTLLHVFHL